MDLTQLQQRLQAIADASPDYERQHGMEDDLLADVLESIALNSTDDHSRALAKAALRSRDLDFQRLCA